jgi:hypothetical protein
MKKRNQHLGFDGVGVNNHTLDVVQLRVVLKGDTEII